MRTDRLALFTLRYLVTPAALALSLAACDGVDDPDALAEDARIAEDNADADEPPISELPVAAPSFADADEPVEPGAAAGHGKFESLDITSDVHPNAFCFLYAERARLNLADQWGTLYGYVKLDTNCQSAKATTVVTNSNVTAWQHHIVVSIQYWTGSSWTTWQTKDSGWTSTTLSSMVTDPTTFAVGTFVRACGYIEGTLAAGSTPYNCTNYWTISSST